MLELHGLTRTYDGFEFGPIDLAVEREVLSVLGPSGSGKTTLLSLIAGIVEPDAGSVVVNGRPLGGVPIEQRQTGLVFQEGALFPHMTAGENVEYAATDPGHADEIVSVLGIGDVLDRRPARLSGGERQRVALARTLAADPAVLLLDEPLSSLDAPIRRRLRRDLAGLFASLDVPVVYVTHDQRTATALGDRLAIVRDGTVEQVGPPATVLDQPATRFVAHFTGTENVLDATVREQAGEETTVEIGDVRLRAATTAPARKACAACIHPARVQLAPDDEPAPQNTVSGTVTEWLNEGTEYRLTVDVDGLPQPLVVAVQPADVDRVGGDDGRTHRLTIPPEAIHLTARS